MVLLLEYEMFLLKYHRSIINVRDISPAAPLIASLYIEEIVEWSGHDQHDKPYN
jgi:hypothetical protein